MKTGVIGHGFVGKAVAEFYQTDLIYDKFKKMKRFEKLLVADVIFICVPTDGTDNGYDLGPLNENLDKLGLYKYKGIIVIKSTLAPGTTVKISELYPDLKVIFSPEFLDQKTAIDDFRHPKNPPVVLVGIPDDKIKPIDIEHIFLKHKVPVVFTDSTTAEMMKLSINAYYTTRVVFANQIYDACQQFGADYDLIAELITSIPRVGTHGFQVFHNGFRGAGGYCLPKDLHTLALKTDLPLLKTVEKINNGLLGNNRQNKQK